MSTHEGIVAGVTEAIAQLPVAQGIQAMAHCEHAAALIACTNTEEPDSPLGEVGAALQDGTAHLRNARDVLETGRDKLKEYVSSLGASASKPASGIIATPPQCPKSKTPAEPVDRHTQKMPDAWPELLALSNRTIANGSTPLEGALAIHDMLMRASDQEIDDNRYFALGELVCVLAQHMRPPEVREAVVNRATEAVVGDHRWYCDARPGKKVGLGMYRNEVRGSSLESGVFLIAREAEQSLPGGVRQLADVLDTHARSRRAENCSDRILSISRTPIPYNDRDPKEVLGQGYAMETVKVNVFSAASSLFRVAIGGFLPEERRDEDVLIHNIIEPHALRSIDLVQAAMNAAKAFHADEISTEKLRECITIRPDGSLFFDKKKVPAQPERMPVTSTKVHALHDTRIGCPALYVGHFIPAVLSLIPDVVVKADPAIERCWRHHRHYYQRG